LLERRHHPVEDSDDGNIILTLYIYWHIVHRLHFDDNALVSVCVCV